MMTVTLTLVARVGVGAAGQPDGVGVAGAATKGLLESVSEREENDFLISYFLKISALAPNRFITEEIESCDFKPPDGAILEP